MADDNDALAAVGKATVTAAAVPVAVLIIAPAVFYETWVAMTLWGWFAPWPLPFGLLQGVGMNLAASTVFRQMRGKDDREGLELLKAAFNFLFFMPTSALVLGWLLSFLLK